MKKPKTIIYALIPTNYNNLLLMLPFLTHLIRIIYCCYPHCQDKSALYLSVLNFESIIKRSYSCQTTMARFNQSLLRYSPGLLILILLCLQNTSCLDFAARLPKVLWVYWDSGFENAPQVIKLSLKNMHSKLAGTGWRIGELSNANLHEYLDQDELSKLIKKSDIDWMFSDQVRLAIVIKYGGVYLDASCFLLENFDWLENINSNPDVFNNYGDHPEVVLFSTTYQSSFEYRIFQNQEFLISPGAENWFIAALPNSTFLKLWYAQYLQYLTQGKEYIKKHLKSNNVKTGALAKDPVNDNHYFSMYEAFHSIIQKKQKELDEEPNPELPLAILYFKLWFIPAIKGPFRMMFRNNINFEKRGIQMLTSFTEEEVEDTFGDYKYLIKLTGSVRRTVQKAIEKNITYVQSWVLPDSYACLNTFYIAKNSILDKHLLIFMSEEQRNKVVVEKESLPWICKHADIQKIVFFMVWFVTIPLVLAFITCFYRHWRFNKNLKSLSKDQQKESELVKIQQQEKRTLKVVCLAQYILVIQLIFVISLSWLIQLAGWYWSALSNVAQTFFLKTLFFFWLIYYSRSILKKKSRVNRYIFRFVHLLVIIFEYYSFHIYSLYMTAQKGEENNNFHVFGVFVALIIFLAVHTWFITVCISTDFYFRLKKKILSSEKLKQK